MPATVTESAQAPTVAVYSLSQDERNLLDGVRYLANRLYDFNLLVLKRDKMVRRVHEPYCDYLMSAVMAKYGKPAASPKTDWLGDPTAAEYPRITRDGCRSFKGGFMPRGSFKSSLGTLGTSLFIPAVIDPDSSIVCVFGTQPLSDTQAEEIHAHIMGNVRFRYLFGKWEENMPNWTKRTKTYAIRKNPNRTPSLMMTSVGADLTGLHPTGVILDDPINEKNYDSEVELSAIERFHDALFGLDRGDMFMWVHGTRWGPTDLYGKRIMGELWDNYDIYLRAAKNPDGTLWIPELLSQARLDVKLQVMGRFLFLSQMMNMVVSRSDRPLASENIQSYKVADQPNRDDMTVLLWCDPGGARGTGHWGIVVIGFTRDENDEINLWVLDHYKKGMTSAKAASEFCDMWWRWRPDAAGCENTGFSQSFLDDNLKPTMRKRHIPSRLMETSPGGVAKPTRIFQVENSFGTALERKLVHILDTNDALRNEIAMFPSGMYDLLDSIAGAMTFAYKWNFFPVSKRKPKVEVRKNGDYQRILDDANRILSKDRRRELAKYGLSERTPVISEALKKAFKDAAPASSEELAGLAQRSGE